MVRAAVPILVAVLVGACSTTDGDVLRSHGADGSIGAGDAAAGGDGGDACLQDGPCPVPSAGNFTVCGRVYDLETTEPLSGSSGPGAELTVSVYDVTNLADGDSPPLATATLNECGWFVASDIPGLVSGTVAVTTDDTASSGTTFVWAGSLAQINAGQVGRINGFALRTATESMWASSAGLNPGDFAAGSLFAMYVDLNGPAVGPFQGTPVQGVEITRNGVPLGGDDYYFSDSASLERRTIAPAQMSTGPNGSGLMTGLALSTEASGSKTGCGFVEVTSMTLVSIVQIQEIPGTCL
jgi:hypothetical protein